MTTARTGTKAQGRGPSRTTSTPTKGKAAKAGSKPAAAPKRRGSGPTTPPKRNPASFAARAGLQDAPAPDHIVHTVLGAASAEGMDTLRLMALDLQRGVSGVLGRMGHAHDMQDAQGEEITTEDQPHLGMRRKGQGVEYIARYRPPQRHKGLRGSDLMRRVQLSKALAHYLPTEVQRAYNHLQRLHATNHKRRHAADIAQAEDDLMGALSLAAAPVAEAVLEGVPLTALPAADLAVYFLAAVYAATKRQYEILYALPTIKAVLPETVYNTTAPAYTDFVKSEHAAPAAPMASTGGGIGAGVHVRQEQTFGPLHPYYQDWYLEEWTVDQHDEMMGQEGAPGWTLLDATLAVASAALLVHEAKLVAFGERPDQVSPATSVVKGLLYSKTPVGFDFANASGVVNYDALANFVNTQHAGAQWSPSLMGDILTLASDDYARLGTQFLNSAGGTMSVLVAILMNVPGLREIRQAREYSPNTAERDRLQDAGNPYYLFYQGGIRVGGVNKRAVTVHRDDPNVISSVTGFSLQTYDNGLANGQFNGRQGLSTGGVKLVQTLGLALGYQT